MSTCRERKRVTDMAATRIATPSQAKMTVLPPQEARDLFDRKAGVLLNISGREFLRRWDAGAYRDLPETAKNRNVMRVAALIPFGRR